MLTLTSVARPAIAVSHPPNRNAQSKDRCVAVAAAAAEAQRPRATSANLIDRALIGLVRATIEVEPIWQLLSRTQRKQMLSLSQETSEDAFASYTEQLRNHGVEAAFDELHDTNVEYPAYYLTKFHGYEDGNLSWQAAFEAKAVTCTFLHKCTRGMPGFEDLSVTESCDKFGELCAGLISTYCEERDLRLPKRTLDVGCSVGLSTRALKRTFPEMEVAGVDASPYFVAVAETEERVRGASVGERVSYQHGVFESMALPADSVDAVYFQFVFHECPVDATERLLKEAARVARPGGIVGFVDVDPFGEALRSLPPLVKVLREGSEPFMAEYEAADPERLMDSAGLRDVSRYPVGNERHHAYFGRIPL